MLKRVLALLLALLLLPLAAAGGDARPEISVPEAVIRPCAANLLTITLPEDGVFRVVLEDARGEMLSLATEERQGKAGEQHLWWNGTYGGVAAPAGEALLCLYFGVNGDAVRLPVTVTEPAPFLTSVTASRTLLTPGEGALRVSYAASQSGRLCWALTRQGADEADVAGEISTPDDLSVDAAALALTDGSYLLSLTLAADAGVSDPVTIPLTLEGFAPAETAAETAPELPGEAPADEAEDIPAPATEIPPEALGELLVEEVLLDDADDTEATDAPEAEETAGIVPEAAHTVALLEGNDQRQYTPSWGSPYTGTDTGVNFWTLPMDITDEEAVWNMLMEPITVLDTGAKKNPERVQVVLRKEPSDSADGVGVATCITQGVHVLETRDDWTLIECYSSSFHDSKVKNWNALVQGWVPTKYLKQSAPDPSMGLVVDKLTQRLYIFSEGKLYDTLLISTGKANAKQPYNETRSGEFLMIVPAVGGFKDGSMVVSMAIRFNGGDLLHEVPHSVAKDGSKYYGTYEPFLGTKASHGCIRVQRHATPKGTNMAWIWKIKKNRMKIVIWEDWQGRQIVPPAGDTVLYYNPKKGSSYHSGETCPSAKGKTFSAFTYDQLDSAEFAKLKRCDWCNPPLRLSEIEAINLNYLPGGDHEPVLTEARVKQGFQ